MVNSLQQVVDELPITAAYLEHVLQMCLDTFRTYLQHTYEICWATEK